MSIEKQSKPIKGGARPGAGRKKGEPNKRTQELQAKVEASGLTPLDYMLHVMRTSEDERMRMNAAQAAAPYVHAKLSSIVATVEHTGDLFDALLKSVNGTALKVVRDDEG